MKGTCSHVLWAYERSLIILFFVFLANGVYSQQLYYTAYVGEEFHMEGPDMGPYVTVLSCHYEASSSGYFYINGWNGSRGADVTIVKYFAGEQSITCRYQYQWVKANGLYEVDWNTITYHIKCKPVIVYLNKSDVTLSPGETFQLSYTTDPSYGIDINVRFTSSDEGVATVGISDGLITAKGGGTCEITAESNSGPKNPTCKVTVKTDPPSSITVKPESLTLKEGESGTFSYELTPSDAYTKVTWSSSNESIATVSHNGQVTAISEGSARIMAMTDNGLSAYGTIVVAPQPKSVSLPSDKHTTVGFSLHLIPTLYPSNATSTFTWTSDNSSVVTVDSNGKIKSKREGNATITVKTENGKEASCRITVKAPVEGMDYRNVGVRVQALRELIKKTIEHVN